MPTSGSRSTSTTLRTTSTGSSRPWPRTALFWPESYSAVVDERDSASELEQTIARYNDAWNAHDVEAILAFHAPGMVFENHTAGDRVEGADVGPHISRIFERMPDLAFTGRRLYARDGLVVSEWSAS